MSGPSLALWVGLGLVSSLGAARLATQLAGGVRAPGPSVRISCLGFLLGVGTAALLPARWLEALDYAGFVLMLYLVLGLLVGVVDLAVRAAQLFKNADRA